MSCHTVWLGDARHVLDGLSPQSVQLAVTSPPYFNKKDYGGGDSQIGFGQTFTNYLGSLEVVWRLCANALLPQGRLCVNVGDIFVSTQEAGRYHVLPLHAEIIRSITQPMIGLDYMNMIIWKKVGNAVASGGARNVMGSYLYPPNGILQNDVEYILIFKKPGPPRKIDSHTKTQSKMSKEEWISLFSQVWEIPGRKGAGDTAAFPLNIPTRLIRMFSFTGDVVLDPFLGTGTTALAAEALGRDSVGVELNGSILEDLAKRLVEKAAVPPCSNNRMTTIVTETGNVWHFRGDVTSITALRCQIGDTGNRGEQQ